MDPLQAALERLLARYRSDVHQLRPPASLEALNALEAHLQLRLPEDLRRFLSTHDGADLFRGTLRVRSAADGALAGPKVERVVLFADGPDEDRWAWALDAQGRVVYGAWTEDQFQPLHVSFSGWLAGTVASIEARVVRALDREIVRFDADSEDPLQQAAAAKRALAAGDPDRAEVLCRSATASRPEDAGAWRLLGEALAGRDRVASRQAWLLAFRATSFPLPWPSEPPVDEEVLRALAHVLPEAEALEVELSRFLTERVRDVASPAEAALVEAVGVAQARSRIRRGRREEARDGLAELVSRFHTFAVPSPPWRVLAQLAALEVQLGHHDEAEALIRRLRREGPTLLRGPGLLLLAEIAIARQEPWAELILDEARAVGLDEEGRAREGLLRAERAVRQERPDEGTAQLESVEPVIRRLGLRDLEARAVLLRADLLAESGQDQAAWAAWERAIQLGRQADSEVVYRARLRQGDALLAAGRLEAAREAYQEAVQGFAEAQLPVREAWALLRLARALLASNLPLPRGLLQAARERFVLADLAAGVAALDTLAREAAHSLGWHLERSAAHTRARLDAQRGKPPWDRSDADRPERRLGAHRLAIAASGPAVVAGLSKEIDACARAIRAGRVRPGDPPMVRYLASVDLLSGHRSYEAAEALLRQLADEAVDGVAWRGLQLAAARSPNAALVDGLLRWVEHPKKQPVSAVAAAAEVLGLRREVAALKPLAQLVGPSHAPQARRAAVLALGRIGRREAVPALVGVMEDPILAEPAALSLLLLGDPAALRFHREALVAQRSDLSGHPGEIVGRYGGPENLLLLQTCARGVGEMALGALQGLGLLGDPRGVPTLVEALRHRDQRVAEVAAGALEILTGHHEDLSVPGWALRWSAWWEGHRDRFPPGVRHRDGKVFQLGYLVERLRHDDAYARRTAYDELVILSGSQLPFDADGYYRVQLQQVHAWDTWWALQRARFPPGRWTLDGRLL